MEATTDPICDARGIPAHLHCLGRASEPLDPGERVYRFFRLNIDEDLSLAISFNYRRSSVNRAKYSHSPADVLWDDERGGQRPGHGVVSFPGDVFDGLTWSPDQGEGVYRLAIQHEPRQCNHAHCSIIAFKGDEKVEEIKPTSVKLKIRKWLEGKVLVELPSERAGQVMTLRGPSAK